MHTKRMLGFAMAFCAAALLAMTATAQPPAAPAAPAAPPKAPAAAERPGGLAGLANLGPDVFAKAWDAQSAYVAKSLSLNDDLTKKLADAYKASRESLMKSTAGAAQGANRGEAFRNAVSGERTKFETAVKGFLSGDQATKAVEGLGSFDMRWDMMVSSLLSLGLEDKVKNDAMGAVSSYVTETAKVRQAAGGDRDKMREESTKLREKLEADLTKILPAEKVAALKELPGFRRGGPGGGPGGGGRQRGEGGRADAPAAPAAAAPAAPAAAAPAAPAVPAEKK